VSEQKKACERCGAVGTELRTTDDGPVLCRVCTKRTLTDLLGSERHADVAIAGAELIGALFGRKDRS
jgi:hypothetical protein